MTSAKYAPSSHQNNDRRALGMTNTHVAVHNKTGLYFVAGRGFIAKGKDASRFDGDNAAILAAIGAEWSSDFWTMQVAWGSSAIAPSAFAEALTT